MNQPPRTTTVIPCARSATGMTRSSAAVVSQTVSLKEARLEEGLCPLCGTQLFNVKTKRKLLLGPTKTTRTPRTEEGRVVRGQCVQCYRLPDDTGAQGQEALHSTDPSDLAFALTLAEMSLEDGDVIEESIDQLPVAFSTPEHEVSAVASNDSATYLGPYNIYGQRDGDDGLLTWTNGDVFHGSFRNGLREGHGTLRYGQDRGEYVGSWHLNTMHGSGSRRFANGDVYTGQYCMGQREGIGKSYFANGDLYNGAWEHGTMHGWGRYYYQSGQSYEGYFMNGKRHGQGKYQWTSGEIDVHRYVNDVRQGEGVRWSANRKKAWRLLNGKQQRRVNLREAAEIARRCGTTPT